MLEIYEKALKLLDAEDTPVIATVISAVGSTPQKAGSMALIDAAGNLWGTLGGGMVEADGIARMRKSQSNGRTHLHEFRLDDDYSRNAGPICGGTMRFFTHPGIQRYRDAVEAAIQATRAGNRGVLITYVSGPREGEVEWLDETRVGEGIDFPGASDVQRCLSSELPEIAKSDDEEAYLEPIVPTPRLLIVGGGHVGQAVAFQADLLGFDVTIVDDREEFAEPELFPSNTKSHSGDVKELVKAFPKGNDAYIVLVSKGHLLDALALEACIHEDVRFLGMIGSRRKILALKKNFLAGNLCSVGQWNRIVSPIGYDIGAVSVQEIGIAIAAQLIAARRKPDAVRNVSAKSLR